MRALMFGLLLVSMGAIDAHVSYAQSHDAPALTFEVATVKPNPHPQGWRMEFTVDGFIAEGVTLRQLVSEAYSAYKNGQVLGGPTWFDTDHFDIQAKLDPSEVPNFAQLNLSQRRQMLQALLADRFQLKVHVEQRTVPAFALRIAKNGIKMQKTRDAGKYAQTVKGYDSLITRSQRGLLEGKSFTMKGLADMLVEPSGRIVVDQTGLKDRYDFLLQWTPEDVQGDSANQSLQDESHPYLFKALEQQLGLKLEPTNTSIDVYVVDHAEQPSGN